MPKGYRPYLPEQDLLLPPSLPDWLPENHLAYFVSDVVDQMDLSPIHDVYERDLRGQPPNDPRMMRKLRVYGYCVGVYSARKIQQRLSEDVGFRVLAAGNAPDFRTISDFRKIHLATLEGLFEQVLKIVLERGAMKLGRVALDGTKVKANASKHKAMSCDRMKEQEKAIRAEVQAMLARAEAEAKGKPEAEAKPEGQAQYNFTDPESRIMKSTEGFVQAYHAQIALEHLTRVQNSLVVGACPMRTSVVLRSAGRSDR